MIEVPNGATNFTFIGITYLLCILMRIIIITNTQNFFKFYCIVISNYMTNLVTKPEFIYFLFLQTTFEIVNWNCLLILNMLLSFMISTVYDF